MDEQKKNKVKEIIESMRKDGASLSEVKASLKILGISELEIEELVNSVNSEPTSKDLHEKVEKVHEIVSSGKHIEPAVNEIKKFNDQTSEMKTKVDEIHGGFTEQGENLNKLNDDFENHKKSLEEINEKVGKLTEKHEEIKDSLGEASFLRNEVRDIKELLLELKPLISGVAELQEKMLETNKELLMRLKKD